MLHDILVRQLRKAGCDPEAVPEGWRGLLDSVSRRYEEDDRARDLLERSIAASSEETHTLNARVAAERDQFLHLFRHSPVGMARTEPGGAVREVNPQFARILARPAAELLGQRLGALVLESHRERTEGQLTELARGERKAVSLETPFARQDGGTVFTKLSASVVGDEHGKATQLIVVIEDITEWTHLQIELRHAQKLESVGRLAAGIAHEINTPIQYVGTNITFLESAFTDLLALCEVYRAACAKAETSHLGPEDVAAIRAAEETADLSYVQEHVPRSFSSTDDGIKRVAKIVQSMKSFAQPDRGEKTAADVNAALQNTITVASNELDYVADVQTDFADLPLLPCFIGDLNQVFLDLLINAAHAVEDVVGNSGAKGVIRIATRLARDHVLVSVSDSGPGIPAQIRDRIFDPFFTTKAVGKGTGQGLSLARSVVVEKHQGTITFDTELGKGTTFHLRLPLLQETRALPADEDAA